MKAIFFRAALLMMLAAVLGGCATFGKDFPADKSRSFELGRTTKKEILAEFGTPQTTKTFTAKKDISNVDLKDSLIVQVLGYHYAEGSTANAALEGVNPARSETIFLVDDKLAGYYLSSSFKSDSTDFDPSRASSIVKGKTTEAEVIAMLGRPSGRGLYPLAHSPAGHSLFYDTVLRNHPRGSVTSKRLSVQISQSGVVEDFSVTVKSDPILMPPAPTPIFIYMPVRSK